MGAMPHMVYAQMANKTPALVWSDELNADALYDNMNDWKERGLSSKASYRATIKIAYNIAHIICK